MIRIGLTGTLGAGKSTVGRLFESWGAYRIDADALARRAVEPGRPAHARIREAFGEDAFRSDGTVDRAALRELVFADPEARRRLEAIVHPEVAQLRERELERAGRRGARVVVEEVPLLFEVGLEGAYDAVVVVDAPKAARAERLATARGLSSEAFRAIDEAQMGAAEKRARADHVIRNDGSRAALAERTRGVWAALTGPSAR